MLGVQPNRDASISASPAPAHLGLLLLLLRQVRVPLSQGVKCLPGKKQLRACSPKAHMSLEFHINWHITLRGWCARPSAQGCHPLVNNTLVKASGNTFPDFEGSSGRSNLP